MRFCHLNDITNLFYRFVLNFLKLKLIIRNIFVKDKNKSPPSNYLTSDDWANQSGTIYWGDDPSTLTPTHDFSPYIGFLQLTNMTVGSGTWIVRYQNVMTTPCSPSAPWREEVYTF